MPTQLDPRFATDAHSSRIGGLIFSSLTRIDGNGVHQPYLAESWLHPDSLTYVFELRHDFRFHDGTPVSAGDVAATYLALKAPSLSSPRAAMLSSVQSVEIEGEDRVVFRLGQPDASFMDATTFGILPARLAAAPRLDWRELIGAGPYRLSDVADDRWVRLTAFAGYAGGAPPINEIEFKIVPDTTMRALELINNSVDLVQNGLDPDIVTWLRRNEHALSIRRDPSNSFQYLGMNLRHPALSRVAVRRAIAYAINREEIVRYVLKSTATTATGMLPPHHWAFSNAPRAYSYDPARARELLDRAGLGHPGGDPAVPRLKLSYKTTTQELSRRIAEVVADQLARVGIELEIFTYEWGTFYSDIKEGNFHLYSLSWVGVTDPDIYRLVYHSAMVPPAGNNRGRYSDQRMDKLTERGRLETSLDRRRRIYKRAQKLAARQLPYIPLWWPDNVVLNGPRLTGFTPHPSGDLFSLSEADLRVVDAEP